MLSTCFDMFSIGLMPGDCDGQGKISKFWYFNQSVTILDPYHVETYFLTISFLYIE